MGGEQRRLIQRVVSVLALGQQRSPTTVVALAARHFQQSKRLTGRKLRPVLGSFATRASYLTYSASTARSRARMNGIASYTGNASSFRCLRRTMLVRLWACEFLCQITNNGRLRNRILLPILIRF
jgi:hypothetical protein